MVKRIKNKQKILSGRWKLVKKEKAANLVKLTFDQRS